MHNLPFHMHWPPKGQMGVKLNHVLHDERFWGLVGIIAFIALMLALAIVVESTGGSDPRMPPIPPYLP